MHPEEVKNVDHAAPPTGTRPAGFAGRGDTSRLETVDCLRGFAALAVMWFHLSNGNPSFLPPGILKSSGVHGWLGVEVFFVISGFILPYALRRSGYQPADYLRFVWRRVIRLDPPYVACIALVMALNFASTLAPAFRGPPFQFDLNYVLLHLGYLNGFFNSHWINPVFWTLALEFQFYLLIALVFPLINHSSMLIRVGACGSLAGIAFLIPTDILVFRWLCLFSLGIWAFHIKSGMLPGRVGQGVGWLLLTAGVWFTLGPPAAIAGISAALLIVHVRLDWPWLLFLGQISYSLYLLHVPIGGRVINLGNRFADGMTEKLTVLVLAVIASIGAAYLFHRWIELPAQRWASMVRYRRAEPPSAAPTLPQA